VFLAVFPIVLAAFVLGRTAAVVCAALATVLSVVVPIINPATEVSTAAQIVGAVGRGRSSSGWRSSSRACTRARRSCAWSWRPPSTSARELEGLRGALTAPELPALDGPDRSPPPTRRPMGWWPGDFFLVAPGADNSTLVVVGGRRRPRTSPPRAVRRSCARRSRSSRSTPTTR
jgi:hypothetical protein